MFQWKRFFLLPQFPKNMKNTDLIYIMKILMQCSYKQWYTNSGIQTVVTVHLSNKLNENNPCIQVWFNCRFLLCSRILLDLKIILSRL